LVTLLVTGGLLAIRNNEDELAGVLLGFATITTGRVGFIGFYFSLVSE
jgi:hypothetical protein